MDNYKRGGNMKVPRAVSLLPLGIILPTVMKRFSLSLVRKTSGLKEI